MQRLDALLKSAPELRPLASQARQAAELQQLWLEVVPPPLRPATRAGGVRHRRITVFADNGAVASRLKLLAPSLLKSLQIKGLEITSIRVEVQVPTAARQARPAPPRTLSPAARASLAALAATLPESPLRAAIARLGDKA